MSQGNSSSVHKETIAASQLLSSPIGINLQNANTRTLAPSMGAIAYGSDANLLYYGSMNAWHVAGMTGSTGQPGTTGMTGQTGQPGATGQPGQASVTGSTGSTGLANQVTSTDAYLWLDTLNLSSTTVADGASFVYTSSTLSGGITYDGSGNVTLPTTGRYLITWGHHQNGAVSTFTELYVNAAAAGSGYRLFSLINGTNIFETQPSVTVIRSFTAGDVISIRNVIGNGTVITIPQGQSLPNTIPGQPVGAYLTITRVS